MKKSLSFIFIILIITNIFTACRAERPQIEDYEWKMRYIIHTENNSILFDAYDSQNSAHPEAKIIDMILIAKDGNIIITDNTNNKTYYGTYSIENKTPEGVNYTVNINSKLGYAGVAMTTYADGSKEATLPISIDRYSLCFVEK